MAPLGGQKLIYLTPAGGFSFIFMVTFYVTVLVVLPFVLYQLYAFIKPAIPNHTRKLSFIVGVAAILLMISGATFGYLYAVPGGLNFLGNFGSEYVTASITADSYLSFVLGYVVGIGLLFELPLLLMFWHWIHPLTPKGLLNSERFVIVGAFIAAAILSPSPDALSQAVIAVPIIVVYQLGVIGVLVSIKKTTRRKKQQLQATDRAVSTAKISSQDHMPARPMISPPAVVPLSQPSRVHQPVMSVDGMMIKRAPYGAVKKQATPPMPAPARPRTTLVVAPRSRMISDFRPMSHSVIDTTR